ncbi:hypothetical protein DRJ25_02830 [Candidatus Woesearchaeota archaeon]|nr:MAG: hypothetical protein DRJ25_02830 [Candidatus Woesearchaeota archaeon]
MGWEKITDDELMAYAGMIAYLDLNKEGDHLRDYKKALSRFGTDIRTIQETIDNLLAADPNLRTDFNEFYELEKRNYTQLQRNPLVPDLSFRKKALIAWKAQYGYLENAEELQDYIFDKAKAHYFIEAFEENKEFEELIKGCELSERLYKANIEMFEKTQHLRDIIKKEKDSGF